jgi:hypothetical protein
MGMLAGESGYVVEPTFSEVRLKEITDNRVGASMWRCPHVPLSPYLYESTNMPAGIEEALY